MNVCDKCGKTEDQLEDQFDYFHVLKIGFQKGVIEEDREILHLCQDCFLKTYKFIKGEKAEPKSFKLGM